MESVAFIQWCLDHLNYWTITLLMAIESSFIPFPSEVVVPPAAYKAAVNDEMNVYLVVLFATIGANIGAIINYYLAYWLGRPIIYKFANSRFGHMCLIDEAKVQHAEEYFDKHGALSTFIGRLIPAVRQLISIPAGLARMSSMGMKDVFANRIMIPIHDADGHPVGFTARRIKESDEAKYINTTETDVYKKGDLIFNYHRAKPEARKAKKVFLVEGAMDVLAFEKVGLHNALATLGTAITKTQLQLLKMLHVPIVVCYDGDMAGKNATYKFGKMAVQEQIAFEIVDNRYGLDPDEIIDAYGKDELIALSSRTLSWIDFLFEYLLTRYNLDNYSQKKEFAMEMADAIKHLQDDFEKESYYIRLRELTDFDMQEKNTAINERQIQKKETFGKRSFLTFPKSGRSHAEYEILSQMLSGISASNYYKEELGFLKDDTCNKLAIYIIDYYRTHTLMEIADLLDTIKEETVKTLALDIADWELAREEVDMEVLKEAVEKVKDCFLDDKIQMLNEKIKTVNDPMEKAKLAGEKNQLIKERGERLCQGRK